MQILNHAGLNESCGGDPEFAAELFSDLEARATSLRAALGTALEAGSADGLRKAAHELKGSSLTLGADRVADVCRRLEQMGHDGLVGEAPAVVAELDQELTDLWIYLRQQGIYSAATT